jgi:hypothetical protein
MPSSVQATKHSKCMPTFNRSFRISIFFIFLINLVSKPPKGGSENSLDMDSEPCQ